MTAQPPDSPPEVLPVQTRRSEAQRTYGRLSRFYDLTNGLLETKVKRLPHLLDCRPIYARRSLEVAGFEVVEARRSSILGLPAEIVMGHKPATSST